MKDILNIAYYTSVRGIRDKKSLIYMLVFPILLILILGTALSSLYKPQNLEKINVAYLNNDHGNGSKYFEQILEMDSIQNALNITFVDTSEKGLQLIKNRNVKTMIIVPEGYTDSVMTGNKASIEIYSHSNSDLNYSVVKSIVDGYNNRYNTYTSIPSSGGAMDSSTFSGNLMEMPIDTTDKIPSAIDYYAVTMLIMIMLYGSQYSIQGLGEDYFENMGSRLRSLPVKLYKQLIGNTIGNVAVIFIQAIIVIIFTKLAFNTNWGSNYLSILFTAFSIATFSIVLGASILMLSKSKTIALGISNILIPISTFISGGYTKINIENKLYEMIKLFLPNSLGQTAIFNTIYGDSMSQTQLSLLILWSMTAVLIVLAVIFGRRKLA